MLLHLFSAGDETMIAALRSSPLACVNAAWTDYSWGSVLFYLSFAAQTWPFIESVSQVSSGGAVDGMRDPFQRRRMVTAPFVRDDFLRSFGPPIETQWCCCVGTRISNDWYWSGFLSSSVSVWEGSQYLQALISLWLSLSLNLFSNVLTENSGKV